jgi:hypothetical protein
VKATTKANVKGTVKARSKTTVKAQPQRQNSHHLCVALLVAVIYVVSPAVILVVRAAVVAVTLVSTHESRALFLMRPCFIDAFVAGGGGTRGCHHGRSIASTRRPYVS